MSTKLFVLHLHFLLAAKHCRSVASEAKAHMWQLQLSKVFNRSPVMYTLLYGLTIDMSSPGSETVESQATGGVLEALWKYIC